MSPITLYGIPNCDQIKKARAWLVNHDQPYVFHDFKKAGVTHDLIQSWLAAVQWETLVNRKGTTWRALSEPQKLAIVDAASATELMLTSPSVIKRPVLSSARRIYVGFSDELYQRIFSTANE